MTWLLYIAGGRRNGSEDRARYLCSICAEWVGDAREQIEIQGRPVRRTYLNPQGIACEIVTTSGCRSFRPADYASIEHTWFAGYQWRPISCGGCAVHLGWRFEPLIPPAGSTPFFGLLTDRLTIDGSTNTASPDAKDRPT